MDFILAFKFEKLLIKLPLFEKSPKNLLFD